MTESREFLPLDIALLTISDTRTSADDKSGAVLRELVRTPVTGSVNRP
jgi:molybdenum cofactor biosynthesis protein B